MKKLFFVVAIGILLYKSFRKKKIELDYTEREIS